MVVLKSQKPFTDRYVFLAFPGLGYVGTIAGRYLVEKWSVPWSGYVFHTELPPVGKVRDGRLLYPINVFADETVVFVLSEVVLPESIVWDVARAILTRARKENARMVLSLSGVLIGDTEHVYGIPSGKTARRFMEEHGIRPIENGVITGLSAATLLLARELGINALLLLGPAMSQHDFNAAVRVVEKVAHILGRDISVAELADLAHRYEHELKSLNREPVPMYG